MGVQSVTPVLNVSSVGDSFVWFETLGWRRGFSWNEFGFIGEGKEAAAFNEHGPADFGSVCSGEGIIFLCRGGQGPRGTNNVDGVWMSWWMESPAEVDRLHATAISSGMTVTHPPTDEPWGVREFHLRHPDGHVFRVSAGLQEEGGV
jgi:hypothetical protein